MMQHYFFKQWATASQAAMDGFQKITQANLDTMQKCMTLPIQLQDPQDKGKALKSLMVCMKQKKDINREVMSSLLHSQMGMVNLDGLNVMFKDLKTSLSNAALDDMTFESAYHKLDKDGKQVPMTDLETSAAAAVNFKNLITSTMYRLTTQEVEMMIAYVEGLSLYMRKLKNARVIEDVIGAQTVMLHHIQSQFKDSTIEAMQIFTAFKAGMNVWTENMVDRMSKSV